MYFSLIDKIDELIPGESIVATKSLAMSEEYLRDHFPKFPVMPGAQHRRTQRNEEREIREVSAAGPDARGNVQDRIRFRKRNGCKSNRRDWK